MTFDKLYMIVENTEEPINESLGTFIRDPKSVIATSLLLGMFDNAYTLPQLKNVVLNELEKLPVSRTLQMKRELPKVENNPKVDKLLKDILKHSPTPIQKAVPIGNAQSILSSETESSNFIQDAMNYIRKHEGVYDTMYKDIYGNWTIGIGHLITPEELKYFRGKTLSPSEIEDIFKKDISNKMKLIKRHFGDKFDKFPDKLKIAILDGYFRGDLSGSPKTRSLLLQGKFKEAANEYLDNAEYRKAKENKNGIWKRMNSNANIMSSIPDYTV